MEYLSPYLEKHTDENTRLVKNVKNMHGMKCIESIVIKSKMYYNMKNNVDEYMLDTDIDDVNEYNKKYEDKLKAENPIYFNKMEEIFDEDSNHFRFREIYF
jgi:hypothetical protein